MPPSLQPIFSLDITLTSVLLLQGNDLGDEACRLLCQAIKFNRNLKVLDLSHNPIGRKGAMLHLADLLEARLAPSLHPQHADLSLVPLWRRTRGWTTWTSHELASIWWVRAPSVQPCGGTTPSRRSAWAISHHSSVWRFVCLPMNQKDSPELTLFACRATFLHTSGACCSSTPP